MTGQRLGHYLLQDKLGEGGMGVVYRARDTRLDRPVALKLLPEARSGDAERRQRFVQEAKAASALNHPNIITIHDIVEEGGVLAIAMEFVDGKTLDQLITPRGMRLNELLGIAIQAADGLASAHAAGIVHRDLKPGNLMVAQNGRVKVLDFGLVKLAEQLPRSAEDPTQTQKPMTEQGTILGTVSYMSPEQAEGKPVDRRSDIFSFGVVLYEMATGQRPFTADSKLSTLAAILHKEPKPASEVTPNIPADLSKIITRCLRKDPARRFQHMDDLRVALQEVKEDSESGALVAAPLRPAAWRRWWIPAGVFGAMAVAGILWVGMQRPGGKASGSADVKARRLTNDSGVTLHPAVSPDGRMLAYASDRGGDGNLDIWVQQMAGGAPVRLTRDPASDHRPAFSPDGTMIAFLSDRDGGGVYVIPTLGGEERRVLKGGSLFGLSFSPDGQRLLLSRAGLTGEATRALTVPVSGGPPVLLETNLKSALAVGWSRDGSRVLVCGSSRQDVVVDDCYTVPSSGGTAVSVGLAAQFSLATVRTTSMVWAGDSLFFSSSNGEEATIYQAELPQASGKIVGPVRRIYSVPGASLALAGGPDGTLVFSLRTSKDDLYAIPLDSTSGKALGEPQPLTNDAAEDRSPSVSAGGKVMAFVSDRSGKRQVWLRDLTTGKDRMLTASDEPTQRAQISPDGSYVAFQAGASSGAGKIFAIKLPAEDPELICEKCGRPFWTPDSRRITYWSGQPVKFFAHDVATRQKTVVISHPERSVQSMMFSPDGHWISFHLLEKGYTKVFVAPVKDGRTGPESEWIQITEGTTYRTEARWSADGRFLYQLDENGDYVAQPLDPVTKRPKGAPFEAYATKPSLAFQQVAVAGYSLAGNKLYAGMSAIRSNLWKLDLPPAR